MSSDRKPPTIEEQLERLRAASAPAISRKPDAPPTAALAPARRGGMALALALLAAGIATGHLWLAGSAIILAILSGALFLEGVGAAVLESLPAGWISRDPARPHVGLGASVAPDAVVEPGAVVEMGADVGPGARICRGAVVRMGASIGADAVIESGAVVGWGVDVRAGAVVGARAVVGAGCEVGENARVPEGMRLLPGTDWKGRAEAAPATEPASSEVDPRLQRIDSACTRIEAELAAATPAVREMLGTGAQTAASLRQTCLGLLEREQALRTECAPEAMQVLEREKADLQKRIEASTDAEVKRSLQSAVAAIEDQLRARSALEASANRLDAELTRLSWTLDGMGAQLVRLRSAGQDAAAADSGVLDSMQQLHAEVEAIAGPLEEVARGGRPEPISEVGSGGEESRGRTGPRVRG